MNSSDVLAADIIIYALKQIQMAKVNMEVSGEIEYWNGEIISMKYLLLFIDKLIGQKNMNDFYLSDINKLFDCIDEKRKEEFELLWNGIWEEG